MQMPVLTWPHPHFGLGFVSFWEGRRIEGNPVGPRPGSESRGAGKKSSPDPTSHCDAWPLMGFTNRHPLRGDGGGSADQCKHLCWVKGAGGSVLMP